MKKLTYNKNDKKQLVSTLVNTLILFLIGLLLTFKSENIISTVSVMFGFFLMVAGIFFLINFFRNEERTFLNRINFLYGVISIIAGMVLISKPKILANLLVFTIGLWITINSVFKIRFGLDLKEINNNRWKVSLLLGVINLVIGLYFLTYSFKVVEVIVKITGIVIMIHAALDFVNIWLLKDQIKSSLGPNIIDVEDLNEQ